MGVPYEKVIEDDGKNREINSDKPSCFCFSIVPSTSTVMIDGPIRVEQAPVRIRHYFAFSLFSALCLCPATGYS